MIRNGRLRQEAHLKISLLSPNCPPTLKNFSHCGRELGSSSSCQHGTLPLLLGFAKWWHLVQLQYPCLWSEVRLRVFPASNCDVFEMTRRLKPKREERKSKALWGMKRSPLGTKLPLPAAPLALRDCLRGWSRGRERGAACLEFGAREQDGTHPSANMQTCSTSSPRKSR